MTTVLYANPMLRAATGSHALPSRVSLSAPDEPTYRRLAATHEAASHSPSRPFVRDAYEAFISDTREQFFALATQIEIEPWPLARGPQPYRRSGELFDDLRAWHLYFYTEADLPADHPLAAYSGIDLGGVRLNHNHLFRCVHDAFGHGMYLRPFGPVGEYHAYLTHAQLYTTAALPALAAETLMQTAWFNYGPHAGLPVEERPFPAQKAYAPPSHVCRAPRLAEAALAGQV